MIRLIICVCLLAMTARLIDAQLPAPTTARQRLEGFTDRGKLHAASWAGAVPFKSIGPSIFSGRVVDIDVNPANPAEMFVAYASGGLWHTVNNGTTLTPVFDREAAMTIGDIAVDWSRRVIWVGTGENNSSRSSYSGVGLYRSADMGKTWSHMGLAESHHIGRIILHPVNPNVVHVACLGALYSENPNRGVYSTYDGGKTWRHGLYVNEQTGAADLVMDPGNPNTLYAATWERSRRFWDFVESGPGTGIYKSTDGGRSWTQMSIVGSGFPTGPGAGRIGLDVVKTRGGTILFAVIDNQDARPPKPEEPDELTKEKMQNLSVQEFLALDTAQLAKFLRENGYPAKYTADTVFALVKREIITPKTLVEFLYDANSRLFDTEVIGPEVYRSADGGKSWVRTHDGYLDQVFYTYGYYFGQIRVAPSDPDKLYLLGVPIIKSGDGGKTWSSIEADNVHGDHHALWVNPIQEGHLVLGNDGGFNISYDDGQHWIKCNQPAVGQFYSIAVDMAKPYNVYGGLQDNGVWYGPSTYTYSPGWQDSGKYPYQFLSGGDGMQVAIDTRDNQTVYTGLQFGHYYRINKSTGDRTYITPQHALGERPYRWNWETPIHLSVHNQDIFYMGAERVLRSMDQGGQFKAISGDLTNGGRAGDVASGTLVALHESPLRFGLLYTGSDDGLMHMTPDGGATWVRISDGLPENFWVSSLQASAHDEGRVYAALNGYRWDHFDSYVFVSDDYGKTWTRIALDLPTEPVNVVREDPVNPDLLYIGTDNGLYISLDRGRTVMTLGDMPYAPVHDLVIHPRDRELVVATHGRSFYKADVSQLQQVRHTWADTLVNFEEKLTVTYRSTWGKRRAVWRDFPSPELTVPIFTGQAGACTIDVIADGEVLKSYSPSLVTGLNYPVIGLTINPESTSFLEAYVKKEDPKSTYEAGKADDGQVYLLPGNYEVVIRQGDKSVRSKLVVKDPEKGS